MKRPTTKIKGFTLIELLVVIFMLVPILVIVLTYVHFTPRTIVFLSWIILLIIIWAVAITYLTQYNSEKPARTKAIMATILGTAIVCLTGWQLTKGHVASGKVQVMHWSYDISVINGDSTRSEYVDGYDKNINMNYRRRKGDKVQYSNLTCYLKIDTGGKSKDYVIDRGLWDKIEEGQIIEFKYQLMGNYITKVY